MQYYKLVLVKPYVEEQEKIIDFKNIIDNKENFPIYARLIGLASPPSNSKEGILVFEDIITGAKIYHSLQSDRFLGKEFLYYEDYQEIDSLIAIEELNKLKKEDIVRYRNIMNELKYSNRLDSMHVHKYQETKKIKMPILSLRLKKT